MDEVIENAMLERASLAMPQPAGPLTGEQETTIIRGERVAQRARDAATAQVRGDAAGARRLLDDARGKLQEWIDGLPLP